MTDRYLQVIIDDVREPMPPPEGASQLVCRTPDDALTALKELHAQGRAIDELWLDHDMGFSDIGEELTIMPVVEWLEAQGHAGTPLDVNFIMIHTSNFYRADVMLNALLKYYPAVMKDVLPCV